MENIMEKELNMVTGGYMLETEDDSDALQKAGYMDCSYCLGELIVRWVDYSANVDAGWAKAGITCVTCPFGNNRYYMNNKRIARCVAMKTIGYPYPF